MDLEEITALYYAEKYDDFSFLVAMVRSGNKLIIEDESIRNFIADRLEGKPLRERGKKPANRKKEERDAWVATNVAIFVCQGLPLYHSEGSQSRENISAFSETIALAKKMGYSYLKNQKSIDATLKRYFQKGMKRTVLLACSRDLIAIKHMKSMIPENTDLMTTEDEKMKDAMGRALNTKLKKYLPKEKEPKK
jgi:hypothetical protein